ncbi:hypothetical protein EYF80_044635 [Liparis tanakae]|uniref:Uncharacterized protein n=1 Tax=Liparis tanakae TaxID=230148 RepID=A0A4Z2FWC3_9TELE|nr:hypothetical protein EYF80_044635 [Liparis tanakae]
MFEHICSRPSRFQILGVLHPTRCSPKVAAPLGPVGLAGLRGPEPRGPRGGLGVTLGALDLGVGSGLDSSSASAGTARRLSNGSVDPLAPPTFLTAILSCLAFISASRSMPITGTPTWRTTWGFSFLSSSSSSSSGGSAALGELPVSESAWSQDAALRSSWWGSATETGFPAAAVGEGGGGDVSSATGATEGEGEAAAAGGCGGGAMEAAPWLFSERDARDLMRLKKPLFLESRFLSAASCAPEAGALAEGRLEGKPPSR